MRRLPAWALIVLVSAAGCSAMPSPGARSAEIEELKARVLELQRKAVTAEVEIARLREEMSRLRAGAPATASAPAARMPGVPATPPSARPAPAPPPPTFQPAPANTGIEESDLEPTPPSAAILPPAAAPGQPRPTGQPITALEPVTAAAQSLYDRAYTLYHQGRFAETETAFREFLERHPRSELADNASYWVGESQYARGDLRSALQTFQDTVERYPTGNKTADALLKVGQCFEGLGDRDSARAAYDAVLERFVDSAAAEVARERRAKLR